MIFKGADCAFGGIAAVNLWWHQLIINRLANHEVLQGVRGFIVEFLQLRAKAAGGEHRVRALISRQDFGTSAIFHGLDMYEVAVVFVQDEHVRVAGAGCGKKAT